jgi:hypothetical protein
VLKKSRNVYVWLATIVRLEVWAMVGAKERPPDTGANDKANAAVLSVARLDVFVSIMISAGKWDALKKTNWGVVTNGMLISG